MTNLTELEQRIVDRALAAALRSPCAKSRRGVVLVDQNGKCIGSGFNHPPGDRQCARDEACRAACAKICVHAEADALASVAAAVTGPLDLVHVKAVMEADGTDPRQIVWKLATSGGPSCWQCARDLLESGLVGHVCLFHEAGWRRYSISEFYAETMRACGLPNGSGS